MENSNNEQNIKILNKDRTWPCKSQPDSPTLTPALPLSWLGFESKAGRDHSLCSDLRLCHTHLAPLLVGWAYAAYQQWWQSEQILLPHQPWERQTLTGLRGTSVTARNHVSGPWSWQQPSKLDRVSPSLGRRHFSEQISINQPVGRLALGKVLWFRSDGPKVRHLFPSDHDLPL